MRFWVMFSIVSLLGGPGYGQTPITDPLTDQAEEDARLEAYIDGVVTAHMRQHETPGVTVGVVKDGRVVFAKGYGFADVEDEQRVVGDDTLFRIGSVSKTFIWTAVMMLVELGKLDLDTDVNQYLQDVRIPATFDEPVTLNHLMAHRGGFEDTLAVFTHSDEADMSITDGLVRDMPARVFPPGARTSYSNWGSTLAAKIVADVSGKSYEQFLQDEIFTPLGMTETTVRNPVRMSSELRDKLAVGYEMSEGAYEPMDLMQIGPHAPAGSIASTAADMARWMLLHLERGSLDNVQLMTPETHEIFWSRAFDDRSSAADLAHGFMTKRYFGWDIYGHGGATAAFFTNMWLVPELQLGIFVSQNAALDRDLVTDLPDLVIERFVSGDRGPGETAVGETLAERAADYAGTFMNNRRSFERFEKLFASGGTAKVVPGDDGSLVVTSGGSTVRYLPVVGAEDTFQNRIGHRIAFGRDDNGRVTHYTGPWGVHSHERIGALDSPNSLVAVLILVAVLSVTTWLGVLWRRGVPARHAGMGKFLNLADCCVTLVLLAFGASVLWAVSTIMSASAAELAGYPPLPITVFRGIGLLLFFVGIAAVLSLWPAWRSSGWNVWRKLHHTLFALSLAALAFMLLRWNVVFTSTAV